MKITFDFDKKEVSFPDGIDCLETAMEKVKSVVGDLKGWKLLPSLKVVEVEKRESLLDKLNKRRPYENPVIPWFGIYPPHEPNKPYWLENIELYKVTCSES